MKILSKKNLVASVVFAALSTTSSVMAEESFNVIVKLKDNAQTFTVNGAELAQRNVSLQDHHQSQSSMRRAAIESFVSDSNVAAKHVYSTIYNGFSATVSAAQLEGLKNNPNVEGVFEDKILHIVGNPPQTVKKRHFIVDWPQEIPQAPLESGASESSYKGAGQHIYVLDTGVDIKQNDLKNNLGSSHAAETCMWPEDDKLCPADYSDDHGHGTHVAGTAAAADNHINALGMAPEATVHAVKVCSGLGSCPTSSILDGLNWAVADMVSNGSAAVANLSLGGAGTTDGVCDADGYTGTDVVAEAYCNATHQGMVVVVAAGNDSDDANFYTPASYDSTITVSSYTSYDDLFDEAVFTDFSNYGSAVTIGAPGDTIMSLNRTHAVMNMSGTSMASPAVAGAVALVLEKHPQAMDYSAMANVRQMLVDNATIPGTALNEEGGEHKTHTEGLLNVRFLEE